MLFCGRIVLRSAKQLVKPSAPTKQLPNLHLQCYKKSADFKLTTMAIITIEKNRTICDMSVSGNQS
jgi:hypothetical protein